MRSLKRAIALAGRGPAAGLHIGILEHLKNAGIEFDVWALSCVGAWVGVVYNQAEKGKEVEQTYEFFRNSVFRDDVSYQRFPINRVSAPDWRGYAEALQHFLLEPENSQNLLSLQEIMNSFGRTMATVSDKQRKWNEGDINQWILNDVLAVNPFVRFWTNAMLKSNIGGLFRTGFPENAPTNKINFEKLYDGGKPYIFHNAWNLSTEELQLFSNKRGMFKPITAASLSACSALPFFDAATEIDGDAYCAGTLIDTVNFETLLQEHPDLDEIWIIRILDAHRYRKPRNLHDALGNLCQLYEATLAESDVKLFKYHVREEEKWSGRIIELKINSDVNFDWSDANLDRAVRRGRRAASEALEAYTASNEPNYPTKPRSAEKTERPGGEEVLKSLDAAENAPDVKSKRNLNAWIDDPEPKVGKPFQVLINIGVPKESAEASVLFVEPDWHGIESMDLLVAVSSIDCEVDPSWQRLTLPRTGNSETIVFKVTVNVAGNHEFAIRVYLERQMIPLQSLSFTVAVTTAAARIQKTRSRS